MTAERYRAPVQAQVVEPASADWLSKFAEAGERLDAEKAARPEDNPRAAELLGKRAEDVGQGTLVINFPFEEGFHCPVCEYPQTDPTDGEYDERMAWSEYRTMLWCHVCRRDYPSALCLPDDPERAITVYLSSVAAILRARA